ncbi:MAG: ABC transporter substrate-binding protein, partial [Propionibacteriaceae bacterium]|nr:ABC transporter substrate-binding protein [Propionibacteriaceae bacterium]
MKSRGFLRISVVLTGAAIALSLSGCATPTEPTDSDSIRIGIAQIVSHPSLDAIREGFKDCMVDLGYNVKYDEQNPEGDQAALTSIANNFKSANLDLVVAITTPVAQAFAQAMTDQPIIFAGVTDPVTAGLVDSFEAPGTNLTGSSDYPPIDDQIQLIVDLVPNVKTIGVVYSSSEVNAEIQLNLAIEAAKKLGIEIRSAAVTNSSEVQQAAISLAGVDAFYVGNDNTVVSAMEGLVLAAEQQGVPVIASDPDSVSRGATAAFAVDQHAMGCQAANAADQVLKGGSPATIPVIRMADLKDSLY